MKMIVTIISSNLVTNSLLPLFCPFIETKNKNQVLSKLVVWQREIFFFCLYRVALYFNRMLNSIDIYKSIFFVITHRIIVPC